MSITHPNDIALQDVPEDFKNDTDFNDTLLVPARRGELPFFEPDVTTRRLPNDGSDRWRELYEKARKRPLLIDA